MLAERLIKYQLTDPKKVKSIISFLCSDSGSHDYTIHRREARDTLGLAVEKPDDELYRLIKRVHDDFHTELELMSRLDPTQMLAAQPQVAYSLKRGLIES